MKKIMVFLEDDVAEALESRANNDYRSVKAMAEKIIIDEVKRSDGLTDLEYVELSQKTRKRGPS